MPRLKAFDKKTATTYTLVHRPQDDPLINDSDAPSQVLAELPSSSKQPKKNKVKRRGDLEEEFGFTGAIRDNEGEAAEHGIFFDDSSYDYMQHMRDLGGSGDTTWVEAPAAKASGKAKQSLEDALRGISLDGDDSSSAWEGSHAGGISRPRTYQDQQDIPDALAGFQPDMDPRLREVLEALDDEEYVEDDEDIFEELAGEGGEEVDPDEWEATLYDNDEEGWESDDTTKPVHEYKSPDLPAESAPASGMPNEHEAPPDLRSEEDGAWLESFARSKGTPGPPPALPPGKAGALDTASSAAQSTASQFARRKKRKGALSASTGFSMTSSALARTEPLSTLDARFDRIAESYMDDDELDGDDADDAASLATGMTGMSKASRASNASKVSAFGGSQASQAPSLVPAGFDSMLDEFLGGTTGKNRGRAMRKAGQQELWGQQSGMDQLEEIRKGLGPARLSNKKNTTTQKV